ncbi:MAG: nitroreductase family protein [Bacteroidales bacterium]|nr:nitroreductase family protein [Bacteroidales bacterium]
MKRIILALAALAAISCGGNNQISKEAAQKAVFDNIMTRTSIRQFTNEPVPAEMIEQMLRAGMAAPTAMNAQPWEFVVLNDRDTLNKLAGKLRYARMLEQAPLAIVVCGRTEWLDREGNERENIFWVDDCSAATENILLAAHALGLGAVWTAAKDDRGAIVGEALGIPEGYKTLNVIAISYPAENPAPKDKWKPEKIHWNKF